MNTRHSLLCLAIIITGCTSNKKEKAESLMRDPVMQDEIFKVIIQDSASLNQFFEKLHQENGRPMMHTMHGRLMRKMYSSSGMDSITMTDPVMRNRALMHMLTRADKDSAFCLQIGDSIMRHRHLSRLMQQKINPPRRRK